MDAVRKALNTLVELARKALASLEAELAEADQRIANVEKINALMTAISPTWPSPETLESLALARGARHALAVKVEEVRGKLHLAEKQLLVLSS